MFKKDLSPGQKSNLKSSVQRGIRAKVLETYPALTPYIEDILPKKGQLELMRLPDRVSLYVFQKNPLFFQHMDDAILPHLTIVHRYPFAFHRIRIDRGAIRFVLSGATLMAPGLTSPGGRLPDPSKKDMTDGDASDLNEEKRYRFGTEELPVGTVVAVEAEGKENACMVGVLKASTAEIKKVKKGIAVEGGHFVGDGLWKMSLD